MDAQRSLAEPRAALLMWYETARRILPWRERPDPYRVWLSEIMLQQTRVETVLPYFERFLARWPAVSDLAAASEEEVLQQWAGLGYYSRARSLHRAARAVVAAGAWPDTEDGLRALPGVGEYTAAAVASIAFGRDAAAVDGNIERVISRLERLEGDPRAAGGRRAVRAAARAWLPPGRAGDWNQALMDLGASICTPRRPACALCPLSGWCRARAAGVAEELPRKRKKPAPRPVSGVCGALVRGGRILLVRRPESGLLAGMWELPGAELAAGEEPRAGLERAFRQRLGLRLTEGRLLGGLTHTLTHRRISLSVWAVSAAGEPSGEALPPWRWVAPEALRGLGPSRLLRKSLEVAGFGQQQILLAAAPEERYGESPGESGAS